MPTQGKLVHFLIVIMFVLLPVYVFSSGGPQLSDGPILLIMGYILLSHSKREIRMQSGTVVALFAFCLWVVAVNMIHYLTDRRLVYFSQSLQVSYTVILFISFTVLFFRSLLDRHALGSIYVGIMLSSFAPLLVKGAAPGFLVRQSLSFNNPNQLALYALTMFGIVLVLNNFSASFYPQIRAGILPRLATITTAILCHCYIFISASRSGLIGLAYLDLIAVRRRKGLLLLLIPLCAVLIPAGTFLDPSGMTSSALYRRIVDDDLYSKLAQRTEGRFNFEGLSLLFGNKEEENPITSDQRKLITAKEVHNTFGAVINGYGLIGGALFFVFLLLYFKTCRVVAQNLLIVLGLLPMHISHNLIRFRTVWILYALTYGACLVFIHAAGSGARVEKRQGKGGILAGSS